LLESALAAATSGCVHASSDPPCAGYLAPVFWKRP